MKFIRCLTSPLYTNSCVRMTDSINDRANYERGGC